MDITNLLSDNAIRNGFDVNKIITTVKANTQGNASEERQLIDEREITLQMNIGLIEDAQNGYVFRKNTFDPETEEPIDIYNNCPDNIFEFLSAYKDKYGKFPMGNVTANYYDAEGDLKISSQGAAEVSFTEAPRTTEVITGKFFDKYKGAGTGETFEVEFGEDFVEQLAPVVLSAAEIKFNDIGGTETTGHLAFVEENGTGVDIPVNKVWFTVPANTLYYMGYIKDTETGTVSGADIKSRAFGTFQLIKNDDNKITKMSFTKETTTNPKINEIEAFVINGYTEEHESYVSGLQIVSNHTAGTTMTFTTTTATDTTNKLRYQFDIDFETETEQNLYKTQFIKYQEVTTYNMTSRTEWSQDGVALKNVQAQKVPDRGLEPPTEFGKAYMYLDPALHLPDIHIHDEEK